MSDYFDFEDEFAMEEFDTKKLSICFCLDVSGSMIKKVPGSERRKIDVMMDSFRVIFDGINQSDDIASFADIGVLTFGERIKTLMEFDRIHNQKFPATPKPYGATPLASVILKANDMLDNRVENFKNKGVKVYMPWLVILTDGQSTEPSLNKRAREVLLDKNRIKDRMIVITVGIGDEKDIDIEYLNDISNIGKCIVAKDIEKLPQIFEVLLKSYTDSVRSGKDSKSILTENFQNGDFS